LRIAGAGCILMASGGDMLIRIEKTEDVAALERVRRKAGDRSGVAAVVRLIREADAKCGDETEQRFMAREQMPMTRAEAATGRRKARKGAK
jgi:hypothetical protein